MAQHDYDIANAAGGTVRADINNVLDAVVSKNSGATAPAATFAFMWWMDTALNLLKIRDSGDTNWVTVASLSGTTWIPFRSGTAIGSIAVETQGTGDAQIPFGSQTRLSRIIEAVKTGTSYTVISTDVGDAIIANRATAIQFNLTAAGSLGAGFAFFAKNINDGTLTINPAGAETIDLQSDIKLRKGEGTWIYTDGSNWRSNGKGGQQTAQSGMIEDPVAKTYILMQSSPSEFDIEDLTIQLDAGTITATIEIDTVAVTGITTVAVTSSPATATATTNNAVPIGGRVTLVLTNDATTGDLSWTLRMSRK